MSSPVKLPSVLLPADIPPFSLLPTPCTSTTTSVDLTSTVSYVLGKEAVENVEAEEAEAKDAEAKDDSESEAKHSDSESLHSSRSSGSASSNKAPRSKKRKHDDDKEKQRAWMAAEYAKMKSWHEALRKRSQKLTEGQKQLDQFVADNTAREQRVAQREIAVDKKEVIIATREEDFNRLLSSFNTHYQRYHQHDTPELNEAAYQQRQLKPQRHAQQHQVYHPQPVITQRRVVSASQPQPELPAIPFTTFEREGRTANPSFRLTQPTFQSPHTEMPSVLDVPRRIPNYFRGGLREYNNFLKNQKKREKRKQRDNKNAD